MLLTIRLGGGPPPIPEWIRKENLYSDAKREGDVESAAAAKAFLICCISIDRSYAVKKVCSLGHKEDTTNMNIKYELLQSY